MAFNPHSIFASRLGAFHSNGWIHQLPETIQRVVVKGSCRGDWISAAAVSNAKIIAPIQKRFAADNFMAVVRGLLLPIGEALLADS